MRRMRSSCSDLDSAPIVKASRRSSDSAKRRASSWRLRRSPSPRICIPASFANVKRCSGDSEKMGAACGRPCTIQSQMRTSDTLRLALGALSAHKLRTALTLLGLVIGVTSLILVMTLIQGANGYVKTKIANLGTDIFQVSKEPLASANFNEVLKARKYRELRLDDARAISEAGLANGADYGRNPWPGAEPGGRHAARRERQHGVDQHAGSIRRTIFY